MKIAIRCKAALTSIFLKYDFFLNMPIFFVFIRKVWLEWGGGVNGPKFNFLNVNSRESLVARIIYRGPDGGGGGAEVSLIKLPFYHLSEARKKRPMLFNYFYHIIYTCLSLNILTCKRWLTLLYMYSICILLIVKNSCEYF